MDQRPSNQAATLLRPLTTEELTILQLIARGKPIAEIARTVDCSVSIARARAKRTYAKLGAATAKWCIRRVYATLGVRARPAGRPGRWRRRRSQT